MLNMWDVVKGTAFLACSHIWFFRTSLILNLSKIYNLFPIAYLHLDDVMVFVLKITYTFKTKMPILLVKTYLNIFLVTKNNE